MVEGGCWCRQYVVVGLRCLDRFVDCDWKMCEGCLCSLCCGDIHLGVCGDKTVAAVAWCIDDQSM